MNKKKEDKKEHIGIPLLGEGKDYSELHPAIDFIDDQCYLGFWIPSKDMETGKILKELFLWNGEALQNYNKFIKDNGFIKKRPTVFDKRISNFLLRSNDPKDILSKILGSFSTSEDVNMLTSISRAGNFNLGDRSLVATTNDITNNITSSYSNIASSKDILKNPHGLLRFTYTQVHKKLKHYLDLDDENYLIASLWSIATYFHTLFNSFPYLFIHGTKRAGKTSILMLIEKMAFNPVLTGSITASAVFRLMDGTRGSLLIDETDALSSSKNKPELRQILLNGYKKGVKVARTNRDSTDQFEVIYFDAYCPKALVNIKGLEDVLEDRTIYINNKRAIDKKFSERMSNIDTDNSFQNIRDLIYYLLMYEHDFLKDKLNKFENKTKIANREWELWKPIIFLADLIGLYDESVKIAEEKIKDKEVEEQSEQLDTLLISCLKEVVIEKDFYLIKTIKEKFNEDYSDEDFKLSNRWFGNALKRLGFRKKRRQRTGVSYFLKPEEIDKLITRFRIKDKSDEKQEEQGDSPSEREVIEQWILDKCKQEIRFAEVNMLWEEKWGREKDDEIFEIYQELKKQGKIFNPSPEYIKAT